MVASTAAAATSAASSLTTATHTAGLAAQTISTHVRRPLWQLCRRALLQAEARLLLQTAWKVVRAVPPFGIRRTAKPWVYVP